MFVDERITGTGEFVKELLEEADERRKDRISVVERMGALGERLGATEAVSTGRAYSRLCLYVLFVNDNLAFVGVHGHPVPI